MKGVSNESPTGSSCTSKRNWKPYSNNEIDASLSHLNFDILNKIAVNIGVQEHWKLHVNIVDSLAPLVEVDQYM